MRTSFVLPDGLEPAQRSPKAPAAGVALKPHNAMCFGCGPDVEFGLHLTAVAGAGTGCTSTFSVEPRFEGGPGVIHGGILSTAFDEAMGMNQRMLGVLAVTAHLEIDFAKPIPLGSTLRLESEVLGVTGRKLFFKCTAYVDDSADPVAQAHSLFLSVKPLEHYKDSYANSQAAEYYRDKIPRPEKIAAPDTQKS